jgi:polyhydroxyalkanoate synthesis repressor PhaR
VRIPELLAPGATMSAKTIQINRYPNRRYYAKHESRYISLPEIEDLIRAGHTVEITDSQTGEDRTRQVLAQIIMERHPDMISLFPAAMLHSMLRSNELMTDFLRDYFRQSLTYLDYLQKHGSSIDSLAQPMHWWKAWLDGRPPEEPSVPDSSADREEQLHRRIEELEQRLRQLETVARASMVQPTSETED